MTMMTHILLKTGHFNSRTQTVFYKGHLKIRTVVPCGPDRGGNP